MNREILFKGFHPDENGKDKVFINGEWIKGKWIYGFVSGLLSYFTDNKSGEITKIDSYYMNCYYDVLASTVGQYTGLTDKNGTKIFEGDIVKHNNVAYEIAYITKYARFAGRKPKTIMSIFALETSEVIGNIHDNPELLEVAE